MAFRDLIEKWRPEYDRSDRKILKTSIASEIVNIIQQKNKGRFLERFKGLDGGVGWMEVDDKRAREKVALCFRSKRRHDNVMKAAAAAAASASSKTSDNSDADNDGNNKTGPAMKSSTKGKSNVGSDQTKKLKKSPMESKSRKEAASKSYEHQDGMELNRMHLQEPPSEIRPNNVADSTHHSALMAAFSHENPNPALLSALSQDQPHPGLMEALAKEQYYRNLAIHYMLNPPPPPHTPAAAGAAAAPTGAPGSTGNPASDPIMMQYYLQQKLHQEQDQPQQNQPSNPYLYNGVLNYPRPN